MCTGPNPQQEPGEIPAPAHMGPPATSITYTVVQAIQPSSALCPLPKPPPLLVLTPPIDHLNVPPTVHLGGGKISLVSIHARSNTIPNTPQNTPKLHPHTAAPSW